MTVIKNISRIKGNIFLPGDKSIAHRALIHAAISMGDCKLSNIPESEDISSTVRALRQMDVSIESKGHGEYFVRGTGGELAPPDDPIDCGNSATTMRLLMGVLASNPFTVELSGDDSLLKRPMERIVEPLRNMGIEIESRVGSPPVKMTGVRELNPLDCELPLASAQVKSSLIYAALKARGESVIREPLLSRDHTEIVLENLISSNYHRESAQNYYKHCIQGPCDLPGYSTTIPGDASSAAYLIALALCLPGSEITIHGMLINPRRIRYIEILRQMGADITINNVSTEIGESVGDVTAKSSILKNVEISADEIPLIIDEIPILAVMALKAKGKFALKGASELRHKESDRLHALAENLKKLGVDLDQYDDGLSFAGGDKLQRADVEHFNDHRILLSLIVLSIINNLELEFDNLKPLNVSFPEFPDYLSLLS